VCYETVVNFDEIRLAGVVVVRVVVPFGSAQPFLIKIFGGFTNPHKKTLHVSERRSLGVSVMTPYQLLLQPFDRR
jgi:hypothetical protein